MKASFYLWSTIIGFLTQKAHSGVLSVPEHSANLEIFSGNPQMYYPEPPDGGRCSKKLYEILAEGLGTSPSMFQASSQLDISRTPEYVSNSGTSGAQEFVTINLGAGNLDITSDLMTGFVSSRLMGMAFGEVFSQARTALPAALARNFMNISCRAADVSAKLDFDPPNTFCNFANIAASLIMCGTTNTTCDPLTSDDDLTSMCPLMSSEWTDKTGSFILNKVGKPDGISLRQAGQDEGYMYYVLFRALNIAGRDSICTANNKYMPNMELVPGWEKQVDFWIEEEGDNAQYVNKARGIPIASLSQKRNMAIPDEPTCEFLLLIRGTKTSWEWRQNFSGQLDPLSSISDILVHRGFNFISSAVMTPLVAYLNDRVFGFDDGTGGPCTLETSKFMISGYSLGGALAHVLSLQLSIKYGEKLDLNVVTFAAPNSLNKAGFDYLSRRVNIRSITNALDPVPQFPCPNGGGLFRCSARSFMGLHGIGRDSTHGLAPNIVEIDTNKLYTQYDFLKRLTILSVTQLLDFNFWHTDPYSCYLGMNYCNANTKCLTPS